MGGIFFFNFFFINLSLIFYKNINIKNEIHNKNYKYKNIMNVKQNKILPIYI